MCPCDASSFEGGNHEVAGPHTAGEEQGPLQVEVTDEEPGDSHSA